MEKEKDVSSSVSWSTYVVGAIIVVAVVGGAWYFRTMSNPNSPLIPIGNEQQQQQQITNEEPMTPSPTPGPITGLVCDQQYYNPKIGFKEYYLNVEGGDLSTAKNVNCTFTAKINDNIVGQSSAKSSLTPAPSRNGSTFRCTTAAVALEPGIPTVVDVTLTDDLKQSATCTATFTYPMP
jgi:hypothetical protein